MSRTQNDAAPSAENTDTPIVHITPPSPTNDAPNPILQRPTTPPITTNVGTDPTHTPPTTDSTPLRSIRLLEEPYAHLRNGIRNRPLLRQGLDRFWAKLISLSHLESMRDTARRELADLYQELEHHPYPQFYRHFFIGALLTVKLPPGGIPEEPRPQTPARHASPTHDAQPSPRRTDLGNSNATHHNANHDPASHTVAEELPEQRTDLPRSSDPDPHLRSNRTLRCALCRRLGHIKVQCPRYFCQHCATSGPGHFASHCTSNPHRFVPYDQLPDEFRAGLQINLSTRQPLSQPSGRTATYPQSAPARAPVAPTYYPGLPPRFEYPTTIEPPRPPATFSGPSHHAPLPSARPNYGRMPRRPDPRPPRHRGRAYELLRNPFDYNPYTSSTFEDDYFEDCDPIADANISGEPISEYAY